MAVDRKAMLEAARNRSFDSSMSSPPAAVPTQQPQVPAAAPAAPAAPAAAERPSISSPPQTTAPESPDPTYRTVGVVLYENHEKVMDEMTAFCKTAGVRGVRKGANTSLFVGAALDRLCEVLRDDPTQFKDIVARRIQSLKHSP